MTKRHSKLLPTILCGGAGSRLWPVSRELHPKIKRIEVKPGARLSLQSHRHRSEHWIVVSGSATVTNGERELVIDSNESTFIPSGDKHRLENATAGPLVIIEVQSGSYLGEDDIRRFEDQYGRAQSVGA